MRTGTIFFCAVLFVVAGCAELPRPTNFRYSSQPQFQSATHWQRIARELICKHLINTDQNLALPCLPEVKVKESELADILKPDSHGSRPRIFVQTTDRETSPFDPREPSPFDYAFRDYLITELIQAGFLLSDTSDAPIQIHWTLLPISRNQERMKPIGIPEFVAGEVVAALSGIRWTTSDPLAPHTELILSTRITIGKDSPAHTVSSYSDTFYINDADLDNYQVANGYSRSIAARDEAWRRRLARQGLLSR